MYRKKNTAKHMLWRVRKRAKAMGVEFDISDDDIPIPAVCPVLGTQLILGSLDPENKPSIDRVDNSRGYVKGNVAVISWKANILKRNLSLEQLEALVRYIKDHR